MKNSPARPLRQPLEEELFEKLVQFRRDLHQHPELSWKDRRTVGKIAEFLDELGTGGHSSSLAPQQ